MDVKEAVEIIDALAADHDVTILDLLEYMQDNLADFEPKEVQAFNRFVGIGV